MKIQKCRSIIGTHVFHRLNLLDTNPGIECCDYFNVKPDCFPLCKQLDIPVNDTEDSRDMTCKTFSGVINECKSGKKKIENFVFQWL